MTALGDNRRFRSLAARAKPAITPRHWRGPPKIARSSFVLDNRTKEEHCFSLTAVGRKNMALWVQDTLAVAGMLLFVASTYVLSVMGEALLT
jgi:hypothetical protein